ncbi:MAG TPA: ABC transporter ATP-binding protein [Streptosporangiaceae bacterium]|jgi:branched-chain amino acid transport system ATP-binding protein|nr:ABC transporter ATP-binding protein [Streptosporangiaceae bacterium]
MSMGMTREPMLEVTGMRAGYLDTTVIRDLSLAVQPGEAAVLIGPNGHGKTTLLRAISGIITPTAGRVMLAGQDVTGRPAERIAALGLVHVPQGDGLFGEMTVEENLMMGAFPATSWRGRRAAVTKIYEQFPVVADRSSQRARTLSGGERRLVALGRALMRPSQIMLIDEPSLGLAPVAIDAVYDAIGELKRSGATLVLVEENFTHVGSVADAVHVIEAGTIIASGPFSELSTDPAIVRTYLGSL